MEHHGAKMWGQEKVKEMHYFQFMGNRTTLRRMKFRSSTQTEGNIVQHTHISLFFVKRKARNISRHLNMCIELTIARTKPRCVVFIGSQGRFFYSLIRYPSVKLWHLSLVVKLTTDLLCTEDLRKSLMITRQFPVRQIVVLLLTGPCFCVVSQPLLCTGCSIFHFTTRHIRLWPSVCLCVCVCVCVCTRVCMLYIYIYVCTLVCIYMYVYVCINWCVCVRACVLAGKNE